MWEQNSLKTAVHFLFSYHNILPKYRFGTLYKMLNVKSVMLVENTRQEMYVLRKTESRSRNHYYRKKQQVLLISVYVRACVRARGWVRVRVCVWLRGRGRVLARV